MLHGCVAGVKVRMPRFGCSAFDVNNDMDATQGKLFISFDVEFPKNGTLDGDASALLVKVSCPPSYHRSCAVSFRRAQSATPRRFCTGWARVVNHILLTACAYDRKECKYWGNIHVHSCCIVVQQDCPLMVHHVPSGLISYLC